MINTTLHEEEQRRILALDLAIEYYALKSGGVHSPRYLLQTADQFVEYIETGRKPQ